MRTEVLECVRELRKNSTPAEKIFWEMVRAKRFFGKKFVRQQAFIFDYEGEKRFFVADFYCAEKKLIIEIDGKIHESQKEKDLIRTEILNLLGLKVVRFTNEEVYNDLEMVKLQLATLVQ